MSAIVLQAPFVTQLRSRPGVVRLGEGSATRATVRVTLPEQWDTIAFSVTTDSSVLELKRAALAAFGLGQEPVEDFVVKLRGWEVLGEASSITEAGARDGSTFLITYRRRRPVR